MKRYYENRRFMSIRYVVLFCLFFVTGILSAYAFLYNAAYVLYSALGVFFLAALLAVYFKKYKLLIILVVLVFAFGAGLLSIFIEYRKIEGKKIGSLGTEIKGRVAEIADADDVRFSGYLSDVEINVNGKWEKLDGKTEMRVFGGGGYAYVAIGDFFEFRGVVEDAFILKDGTNSSFYRDNVYYRVESIEDSVVISYDKQLTLNESIRGYITDTYSKYLDDKAMGIAVALILGDTAYVENISAYEDTGLMHLFAVSGLHVSFVVLMLGMLLPKRRKWLRFIVIMSGVTFYAWICGFPPSILRALIMSGCILAAHNRGTDGITSLALSMIIVLMFKPLYLFDGGFQMSYASMFGIVTIGAKVSGWLKKKHFLTGKTIYRLLRPFVYSFSASIGLLSVLVQYFGYFSVIGILITPIVLAVVSVVFILLILCLIPFLKYLFILPNAIITTLDAVILFISKSGLGGVNLEAFGIGMAILFMVIFVAAGFINLKRKAKVYVLVSLFTVFVCLTALIYRPDAPQDSLLILDVYSDYCTVLLDKKGNFAAVCNITNSKDVTEIIEIYEKYDVYSFQLFITNTNYTDLSALIKLVDTIEVNEIIIFGGSLSFAGYDPFPDEKLLYETLTYNPFNITAIAYSASRTAYVTAEVANKSILIFDRYYSSASYFNPDLEAVIDFDIVICPRNASLLIPYAKTVFSSDYPVNGIYSTLNLGSIRVDFKGGKVNIK